MKSLIVWLAVVTLVPTLSAAPAIPGKPKVVADGEFQVPHTVGRDDPATPVDESIPVPVDLTVKWSKLYFQGQWDALQDSVIRELGNVTLHTEEGGATPPLYKLDFDRHLYSVVILSAERKPDGELLRFLVGKQVTEKFTSNLRGESTFREIFVTTQLGSGMQSFVNTTPLPNPLESQAKAFIKALPITKIAELPLIEHLASIRRSEDVRLQSVLAGVAPPPPPETRHFMAVYELELPVNLATVAMETFVALPDISVAKLRELIEKKKASIDVREARGSECLKMFNDTIAEAAVEKAETVGPTPTDFGKALPPDSRGEIAEEVRGAYKTFVSDHDALCAPGQTEAMIAIEASYLSLVDDDKSAVAEGSFTYDNITLRRYGLMMTAAAILRSTGDQRGAVEDGKLARKELQGEALTSLNVTWHPVAFDPTNSKLTAAERWKLFAGVVTTPELGVSAGIDLSIYKNFGLSLGYGYMRVEERCCAIDFDGAVGDGVRATRKGTAGGWFFGVSYEIE